MDVLADRFLDADISRDRDRFLRELLCELSRVLEDTVGLEAAEGFVAIVGNRIGDLMNREYRAAARLERMDVRDVASALVDLKRRIEGGFEIESLDAGKIVLVNSACPFKETVAGRKSLCMMTSNVFGRIAAANLNYARVGLTETIAEGHPRCRVIVHLAEGSGGREYFG